MMFKTPFAANLSGSLAWLLMAMAVSTTKLPAAEPFTLSTKTTDIPERGPVTLTVLRTADHEFIFLPPSGWRSPQVDAKAGTLTWTSQDDTSRLQLKINLSGSGRPTPLRPEELRQVVLQELPAAKITEEFTCHTGSGSGPAFDLERVVDGKFPMSSRVAYFPFSAGRTEVHLSSPTDQFTQRQHELTGFLNSFQVQPLAGR
jgi:hypothetical protein